jgi:hypothetical protein
LTRKRNARPKAREHKREWNYYVEEEIHKSKKEYARLEGA